MTSPGDASTLSVGLFELARAAGARVHSAGAQIGEKGATPAEAVRRAAGEAGRGAVVLLPRELAEALPALADAVTAHAPIVVHVAFAAGDDAASLAPLCETGAAVVVTWAPDEAAYVGTAVHRAAADSEMPFVHVYDAPADGGEIVQLGAAAIEGLLGGAAVRSVTSGGLDRARVRSFASRVPFAIAAALRAASEQKGHPLPALERFETADADEVIVTYGRTFPVACGVARAVRAAGRKVGVLGVRALRPFLATDVVKAIARARSAVVIEPLDAPLDPAGPLAACVKGAFFDALTWAPGFPGVGRVPPVVSVTSVRSAISAADVEAALAELSNGERARRVVVLGSEG